MIKEEIVSRVSRETGYARHVVERVVDELAREIIYAMGRDEKVQFRGFGTFQMVERAERVARNPHTNEEVKVPAKRVPVFKPGNAMKKVLVKEEGLPDD